MPFILCTILISTLSISIHAFPGDLDYLFGNGGRVITPLGKISSETILASELQPDGKIVLGGWTFTGSDQEMVIIRLFADGTIDPTFGTNGFVTRKIAGEHIPLTAITVPYVTSLEIQPDGKIVAAGFFLLDTVGDLGAAIKPFFMRMNPDGSFDSSFGTEGLALFENPSLRDVWSIALQTDGKIVAVGTTSWPSAGAIRVDSKGTLDTSFGNNGHVEVFELPSRSSGRGVEVQEDGKIVVAGDEALEFAIARLNPDGSFDHRFGIDGRVVTPLGSSAGRAYALGVQSDGKIVAAGFASDPNAAAVVRYDEDGSLDPTFNGDGIVNPLLGSFHSVLRSLFIQPDGKIVVGGHARDSVEDSSFALARINTDGSPDLGFGDNGKTITPVSEDLDFAWSVMRQPDNKIVLAGYTSGSDSDFAVARYDSDGELDTGFGSSGIAWAELGNSSDEAMAVAVQADGKLVVGGVTYCCKQDFRLARYDQDGSLDPSFGDSGIVETSIGTASNFLTGIEILPGGKILAVGYSRGDNDYGIVLAKFNSDGSLDETFGTNGIVLSDRASGDAVAIQPDGKILVGGQTSTNTINTRRFMVLRFNPDGSPDNTFGINGEVITTVLEPNHSDPQRVTAIKLQPDGSIVVAGAIYFGIGFDTIPGGAVVLRYDTDGKLDSDFGTDGFTTAGFPFGGASDLEIQPDGKILIVNGFEALLGNFIIVRFNPDGTTDSGFGNNGSVETPINDGASAGGISLQDDGKIIVAGTSVLNRDLDFALARYDSNGSLDLGFGSGGIITTDIAGNWDRANDLALQADGKIVAVGYSNNGMNRDFAIVRYLGNPVRAATVPYDFDGDGRSDMSVFRPSEGNWYLNRSTSGFTVINWGSAGDTLVPGDYDGDGRTDTAIFRPTEAAGVPDFYVLNSNGFVLSGFEWGVTGDIPVVGDYDGDGIDDVAIYRPGSSTWYVLKSGGGITVTQFGGPGDVPLAGDFDGDGLADPTTFNGGTWNSMLSGGGTETVINGAAGDIPVPGDYDGDGKTDRAVWRDSDRNWYLLLSGTNAQQIVPFGATGDIPVPADYDGDGKYDISIYRNGEWWTMSSGNGSVSASNFGVSTDVPVPGH